jgi:hypothetical protein
VVVLLHRRERQLRSYRMGGGRDDGPRRGAFLGTEGYAWDTQSDMLMALIGAVVAQVVLGKVQCVGWALFCAHAITLRGSSGVLFRLVRHRQY